MAIVLAFGLAVRLIVVRLGEPFIWPDTRGYTNLAQMIQQGDFTTYYGARTPGYPLLILLLGFNNHAIVGMQLLLGLITSLLTYWLCHSLTRSSVLATLCGILFNLNAAQLVYEMSLMTETLSTFTVTLCVWLWVIAMRKLESGQRFARYLLAAGFTGAYSALVRPSLTYLPFVLGVFSLVRIWKISPRFWRSASLMFLPALALLGGWSAFNYSQFGIFTLSTISGHSIISMTMGYVEYAPDQYAPVRDVLLAQRPATMRTCDIPVGVKSLFISEVSKATGMNFAEVTRAYWKLSLAAIFRAPHCFLRIFLLSWDQYWHSVRYYEWNKFLASSPGFLALAVNLWEWLQPLYKLLTALFLISVSGLWIYLLAKRFTHRSGSIFLMLSLAMVSLLNSLVHTALVVGNYRYQLPVLPLSLGFVFGLLVILWEEIRKWFWLQVLSVDTP